MQSAQYRRKIISQRCDEKSHLKIKFLTGELCSLPYNSSHHVLALLANLVACAKGRLGKRVGRRNMLITENLPRSSGTVRIPIHEMFLAASACSTIVPGFDAPFHHDRY